MVPSTAIGIGLLRFLPVVIECYFNALDGLRAHDAAGNADEDRTDESAEDSENYYHL